MNKITEINLGQLSTYSHFKQTQLQRQFVQILPVPLSMSGRTSSDVIIEPQSLQHEDVGGGWMSQHMLN